MFLLVFTTYSDDYDDQSESARYRLFTDKKKAQKRGISLLYEEVIQHFMDHCDDDDFDECRMRSLSKHTYDFDNDDESDCDDDSNDDSHKKSIKLENHAKTLEDHAKTLKDRSYYSMKNVKELLNMVRGDYVEYLHDFHIVRINVDTDEKDHILNHKTDNDEDDDEEDDEDDDE